jgi:hypothetical protein
MTIATVSCHRLPPLVGYLPKGEQALRPGLSDIQLLRCECLLFIITQKDILSIKRMNLYLRHSGWAAYARQSLREQAENDRLAEYLLTCTKLAKQADVIIPREYVIYDVHTSEDLDRPGMGWL